MDTDDLIDEILDTWRRHDDIMQALLDGIPRGGLEARPSDSRGRDVSRMFYHLERVRRGWVHYHATGKRPQLARRDKGKGPTKAELRKGLKASRKLVEGHLVAALRDGSATRKFGRSPLRWLAYLISHESHHRGQMMLALKQSGQRLPEQLALGDLWGRWIMGR